MTTLASGSSLAAGQSITSPNGKYQLELQADGNLVLSGAGGTVWDTGTAGKDGSRVDMQADGNFVLYTAAGGVVWRTDTADKPGAHLVLQDDRNLVIYAADGSTVLWSPNTYLTDAEKAAAAQQEADAKAKADADAAAAAAAAAPPATAAPAAPAQQTYTVVRGDTLSAIAKRFYGKASDYKKIASANNIANPDLIHPGQNLIIP
jgi:nucleoid-associated protein YgaU